MYHIVQENCFNESNYNNLIIALERLNLDYEIVKVLPFMETFKYNTDRKDIMVWGAVKLAKLAKKLDWTPGSFLNENHDFLYYKEKYGENLFNYNSKIIEIGSNFLFTEAFFARPTSDNKAFNGKVYNREDFLDLRNRVFHNKVIDPSTLIQISGIKKIYKEIRFWIVKGKIVTASVYKTGSRVYSDPDVDQDAYEFCQKMVDKFQLANAFVMDLCLGEDGYKIMECGCINSAGFYAADMQKLVIALEENF